MKINTNSPYFFSVHDLPRRAGEMREYDLFIEASESVGLAMASIPAGSSIKIHLKVEAVDDGVLASASVDAKAVGECIRCLAPMEFTVDQFFQELYQYERSRTLDGSDDDEILYLVGDFLNLETPIRDAVVLAMPANPLCRPDCEGLCSTCGEKWADLPPDHLHEVADARWSGLSNWQNSKG